VKCFNNISVCIKVGTQCEMVFADVHIIGALAAFLGINFFQLGDHVLF